jgi:hypothetical protein
MTYTLIVVFLLAGAPAPGGPSIVIQPYPSGEECEVERVRHLDTVPLGHMIANGCFLEESDSMDEVGDSDEVS